MRILARCPSRSRRRMIGVAATGSVAGWGVALYEWWEHGFGAGVDPLFMLAAYVGITCTIILAQAVVMPDQARIFALGVERGLAMRVELDPQPPQQDVVWSRPSHLTAVR